MIDLEEDIPEFNDKETALLNELGLDDDQNEDKNDNIVEYISSHKIKKKGKVIGNETVRRYTFSNSLSIIKRDYNNIYSIIEEKVINIIENDSSISEEQTKQAQELLDNDKLSDIIKMLNITDKIFTDELFCKIYNDFLDEKTSYNKLLEEYKLKEENEINKLRGKPKEIEKGLYFCKKCGSYDVKISLSQTRRADEPETMFVDCNICKARCRYS